MEIKINIEKKHLYILVVICLITIGVVVIAQTGAPVFYHTLAEIYDTDTGSSIDADGNGVVDSLAISGSLGIGTTSPSEKLDVAGNIKASGTICDSVGCIGVVSGPVWTESDGDVYRDSGDVGIGTTSPEAKLHIIEDDGNLKMIMSSLNVPGGWKSISWEFHAEPDYLLIASDYKIPRNGLAIDINGNVGIGMTNPAEKLEVNGNIEATGNIKATGGLIIETRTSDLPTTEETGRIWLRTDI